MRCNSSITRCVLALSIGLPLIFAGCGKNASPTAGDSTSPVEISGNFGALMNPNLSSRQMMFHGIKIGDPESAVLALPNAHEAPNGLVDFEAWHVAYLVKGGYVTELYIAGPELSKSLDLHHSGDIEVKFGRADIADDSESQGEYDYSGRHLRIAYGPPEAGLSTLWVSVTLVR